MHAIPDTIFNEVREAYRATLVFPSVKPERQFMLCPIGLVGAGKTTVMKPLAEKLSLLRISSDDIRKCFHDRGYGYERTTELAFSLLRQYLGEGYSVAVDSDCISKTKEIEQFSRETNVKIIWIHVNPPESFIMHKLSHLAPNWLGTAEEMVQNYYERKPLHAAITLPFTFVFDTSRDDITEQIECAIIKIKTIVS